MTRTALALSPHLDDAAFSCGGTLSLLAGQGWRVILATLFTASVPHPTGFALACQTDKGLPPDLDYMALRREEDVAAAAALGVGAPLHLALPEAPHRGYDSAAALFGALRPDDWIAPVLAEILGELVDRVRPDLVLAPQAIGGHVDHVQVTGVFGRLPARAPVLWWRDCPYTARNAPAEPFAGELGGLPELTVALTPEAARAKRAACAAYASQIGFQFGGLEGLDQRLREEEGVERFRQSGLIDLGLSATV